MIDEEGKTCVSKVDLSSTFQPLCKESRPNVRLIHNDKKLSNPQKTISKRFKLHVYFVGLLLCLAGYHLLFSSHWDTSLTKKIKSLASKPASCNHYSLQNAETHSIMDLPPALLPTVGKNRNFRRLVIVGDIHGMRESLENLLDELKFDISRDHLVLVGDLIAKGPDSIGVVDLAMKMGATCVRGNHEDQVILAWDDLKSEDHLFTPEEQISGHSKLYDNKHKKLAMALGKEKIEWIKTWPLILRVGNLGTMGHVIVSHAGLEAGIPLEEQKPHNVMYMRSIYHGTVTDKHKGTPWSESWNKHQKTLPADERQTIIYGHDAKRGLKIKNYSLGIDSGCFKGKKLTAAVLEGDEQKYTYNLVRVKCNGFVYSL